jgi:hypothetical protein
LTTDVRFSDGHGIVFDPVVPTTVTVISVLSTLMPIGKSAFFPFTVNPFTLELYGMSTEQPKMFSLTLKNRSLN